MQVIGLLPLNISVYNSKMRVVKLEIIYVTWLKYSHHTNPNLLYDIYRKKSPYAF